MSIGYTTQVWEDGNVAYPVSAERMTHIEDGVYGAHNPDSVKAYRTPSITTTTAVWITALLNSGEHWDTNGMHSTSSNSERLICRTEGEYHVSGKVSFAFNATGMRGLRLISMRSGVTTVFGITQIPTAGANDYTMPNVVGDTRLSPDDYVVMQGYQASGGNLVMFDIYATMRQVGA